MSFSDMMKKIGDNPKLQEMQQTIAKAYLELQREHALEVVSAKSDNGAVIAEVSLSLRLTNLTIKAELIKGGTEETEALIMNVVNEALERAASKVAADMTLLNRRLGLPGI